MATTLSHHHQQHHHHHNIISNSPDHFCKDCGVMFESSTSLEVHLSYHKENLLSRWASQDNMDKATHLPSPSQSPISSQRPSSANNNNNSSNRQTPPTPTGNNNGYSFTTQPVDGHNFVIPQYNNNTGDHNLEPSESYRHHFGQPAQPPPPPVDSHLSHLYGHPAPQHSPYSLSHHPMFSPHHHDPGHNNNNNGPIPPPPGARDSAEILDLDSHKVHIYQHQQQQLAAERNGSNFFHRPYLPHPNVNGWPPSAEQQHQFLAANSNGSPHPATTFPGEQHQPSSNNGYPPVTSNNSGVSGANGNPVIFDVVRAPGYPNMDATSGDRFGQPPIQNGLPPHHHSPYGPPGNSPYPSGPQPIIKTENLAVSPGVGSPQRSPSEIIGGNERMIKSAKGNATNNGNGGGKTKGWRGGECKRPKTYNCTACNKWFTSSGHLKRHYGTTLHKVCD